MGYVLCYVICGTWYVVCGMWYVVCGMWYVVCGSINWPTYQLAYSQIVGVCDRNCAIACICDCDYAIACVCDCFCVCDHNYASACVCDRDRDRICDLDRALLLHSARYISERG